ADAHSSPESDVLAARLADPARAAPIRDLLATGGGLELTSGRAGKLPAGAPVAGTRWAVTARPAPGVAGTISAFPARPLWFAPSLTALALALAWGLVVSVHRPLAQLTRSAERIAAGNLRDPVPSGSDEIGRLGTALDNMRVRLKASIEDVER